MRHCGLTAEAAARFGTHSGRRGAAHEARAGGATAQQANAFGGVTSESWADTYADGCVPAEQHAVSEALARAVCAHGQ